MVAQKISNVLHFQKRCKYINTNGTLVDVWGMAKSHSRRVSLFHNCKCFVCIYEMTRLATLARWLQQIVIVLQNFVFAAFGLCSSNAVVKLVTIFPNLHVFRNICVLIFAAF